MNHLMYPIGRHEIVETATTEELANAIDVLRHFPSWVEGAISNMDAHELATAYRPNGWTVNEVVHHCAESHMHCLMRLKFALCHNGITIMPYNEAQWVAFADSALPINNSTTLLHTIHKKLVSVFESLAEEQWQRNFFHPEQNKHISLMGLVMLYAWHCKHHFAHIMLVKNSL